MPKQEFRIDLLAHFGIRVRTVEISRMYLIFLAAHGIFWCFFGSASSILLLFCLLWMVRIRYNALSLLVRRALEGGAASLLLTQLAIYGYKALRMLVAHLLVCQHAPRLHCRLLRRVEEVVILLDYLYVLLRWLAHTGCLWYRRVCLIELGWQLAVLGSWEAALLRIVRMLPQLHLVQLIL